MSSSICQRLVDQPWRPYSAGVAEAPHKAGIYAIGLQGRVPFYLYLGHSKDIRRRLPEHKYRDLKIDQFVKEQITLNDGRDLLTKWVVEGNSICQEGNYLTCLKGKLGYWPPYNLKRGNTCNHWVPLRSKYNSLLQKRERAGTSFLRWLECKSKHFNWNFTEWKATQSSVRIFSENCPNGSLAKVAKIHTNPHNVVACLPCI